MNAFFDNTNKNDMGKLIHVGAGSGNDLNDYVTQNFSDILLIEPIPKVFKQLESKIIKLNKISAECNISALNFAVSNTTDTDKEKTFYITQPNRYSGLHKANKLKTLFQNLKTEQEIKINTISLTDLIKKLTLDKNKKNALVLQINGAEFGVLTKARADDLMLFSSIVIQQGKNDYFEQASGKIDLTTLMKDKGFQLAIKADNDVVFSSLVFRKDESSLKIKALHENSNTQTARIVELESKLKATHEATANEANKTAEQKKTQAARIAELESELKSIHEVTANEANKTAEQKKIQAARITELEAELKSTHEATANEANKTAEQKKIQAARIAELEAELRATHEVTANGANKTAEQKKIQAARIAELEKKNSNLESEKQELIYRQTKLDNEIVKVEAQLELVKDVVLREKAF